MAYRLKTIRYKDAECRILLQNENGPCPLLAAGNALLLRGCISFPAHCIRNGVASLEDVTNMLANRALLLQDSSVDTAHQYIDELLQHIPTFQFGMDVNPQFTQGIAGYEYTAQLNAFDLLRVQLVHGWLVDPQEHDTYEAIGRESYNTLVEKVIEGNEAAHELYSQVNPQISELETEMNENKTIYCDVTNNSSGVEAVDLLDDNPVVDHPAAAQATQEQQEERLRELHDRRDFLAQRATRGTLINHFLDSTGHQLTLFGLHVLHDELKDDELVVFFRNNHFGTLTKHQGLLYLLVTDLGYANTPDIVWEKLDVIDGDTELVNSNFQRAGEQRPDAMLSGPTLTPEQLLAQSSQKEADYRLALHLSQQPQDSSAKDYLDDQEGQLMAAATEASLRSYHGLDDAKQPSLESSAAVASTLPPQIASAAASKPNLNVVAVGIPVGSTASATIARITSSPPPASGPPPHTPPAVPAATDIAKDINWSGSMIQEEADKLLAMQLQSEQEEESLHLARKLQDEENRRASGGTPRRQQQQQQQQQTAASPSPRPPRQAAAAATPSSGKDSGCIIS